MNPRPDKTRHQPDAEGHLLLKLVSLVARRERRDDFVGDLLEMRGTSANRGQWIATLCSFAFAVLAGRLRDAIARLFATVFSRDWQPLPSDLRSGFRRVRRAPAFSFLALSTIAGAVLCVTISTALVRSVLFVELPYHEPERLAAIFTTERNGAELRNPSSPADFLAWRDALPDALESMTAARPWSPTLATSEGLHKLDGVLATPSLFELLGAPPLVGRPFDSGVLSDDARPVVLSYRLARRLGESLARPGTIIRLDGEPYQVAAVMQEGFVFPPFWAEGAELWAPLELRGDVALDRDGRYLRVFARLADGVTIARAQARIEGVVAGMAREFPQSYDGIGARLEPLREPTVSAARPALLALFGASVAVVILVAFNLASLMVAQRLKRAGEIEVRKALGASALRLRIAAFWETAVLTGLGSAAGILAAVLVLPLLRAQIGAALPLVAALTIDTKTVAVTLMTTLLLTTLVGVPGVARRARTETAKNSSASLVAARQRRRLVVVQLAATVALLVTAGLLARSFATLTRVDPGFHTGGVAAVRIDLSQSRHRGDDRQAPFYAALERALEGQPEIEASGLINHLPIEGDLWRTKIFAPGLSRPDDDVRAAIRVASPGYLRSLRLQLVAGRWLDESDSQGALTVVLNRAAARTLWGDENPTGRELALDSLDERGTRRRVVGIVEDVKQTGLGSEVIPEIYLPLSRNPFPFVTEMTLVARTASTDDPAGVLSRNARTVLDQIAPAVPVYRARALEDVLETDLSGNRLLSYTISGFALAAMALAAFGLFAVVAYTAASRNRELAIRLALGSTRHQLSAVVLREGIITASIGIASGLVLAALSTTGLAPLLYGIHPLDGSTYGLVGLGAAVLSTIAITIPALRASAAMTASSLRL